MDPQTALNTIKAALETFQQTGQLPAGPPSLVAVVEAASHGLIPHALQMVAGLSDDLDWQANNPDGYPDPDWVYTLAAGLIDSEDSALETWLSVDATSAPTGFDGPNFAFVDIIMDQYPAGEYLTWYVMMQEAQGLALSELVEKMCVYTSNVAAQVPAGI